MSAPYSRFRFALAAASAFVAVLGCAPQPEPIHHPAGAAVADPCSHSAMFQTASRDRLNHLQRCGAINEDEWSCMGTQLEYLGDDLRRRCDAGKLAYSNVAGEQRRRYATCIVPFDAALVDCGLFTTDIACGEALCSREASLPAVSAAPAPAAARAPGELAIATHDLLAVEVHRYQGACDFRLDTSGDRTHLAALIDGARPGSVVARKVRAEFYLRFTGKDGTRSELVLGEQWLVPLTGDRSDTSDGWHLPDLALRDYLRKRAQPCR